MDRLAPIVVAKFLDRRMAVRVAEQWAAEQAAAAAAKRKKLDLKVKVPDHGKLDHLMTQLPFAVKVLRQKPEDPTSKKEVERLMDEYTKYSTSMHRALDEAIPKESAKERERADELFRKVDFFTNMNIHRHVLTDFPAEKFAEEFKKAKPIWAELQQMLKGQMVLLANLAMEHPSEEAKKKYLQEHPGANPANHKVKGEGGGVDHGPAEAEGHKGQARFDANKKHHGEMKALLKKVENADPSAKNKFDAAYDKVFENGEAAAKAAQKLLQKYGDTDDAEAAVQMLGSTLRAWENNKADHIKGKGAFAGQKMRQGTETYAHAQNLESFVKDFHKFLKDPDAHVDESWRH